MKAFTVVVLGTLLLAALAGCSGTDSDSSSSSTAGSTGTTSSGSRGTGTSTGTSTGTATSTSTGTTGPSNTPPVAKLSASNTKGNGTLNVTFTPSGTDLEGDKLTYVLNFGDKTADSKGNLPTSPIKHSYTAVGNYTARLTVSDGVNVNYANVTIAVTPVPIPAATEYSCTVDIPAVVISTNGILPVNHGECTFTDTTEPTVLVTATPASGCTIRLDEDTGDTSSGGVVEAGSTNPPGQYGMRCDAPAMGGEGKVSIRPVA